MTTILHTSLVPTPRMLKACALFGVCIARQRRLPPPPPLVALAREIDRSLAPGAICLIQGSSGSGKSTLLALIERRARVRGQRVRRPSSLADHASLLDQCAAPLDTTIAILSSSGITEPALMVRPPSALSEGQRHRAILAITLLRLARHTPTTSARPSHTPHNTTTLLIDEFTSTLDPLWAAAVARALPSILARLHAPIRVIVATSRPDLDIPGAMRVHLRDLPTAA